jgi:hypothetical protein
MLKKSHSLVVGTAIALSTICALQAPPIAAQEYTVNVLIVDTLVESGEAFVEQLANVLDPEIRDQVVFQHKVVSAEELEQALETKSDTLAIVESRLPNGDQAISVSSYELPFAFAQIDELLSLQNAPFGSQEMNRHERAGTGGHSDIFVVDRVDSIDVDPRLLSFNHAYVFENEIVLNDLHAMLANDSGARERGLQKHDKSPFHYWRYPVEMAQ